MKSWLALVPLISLGAGCDVGGGNLTGAGGGTLATGAGGAGIMTGSGGGIVPGRGGAGPGGASGGGGPDDWCGVWRPTAPLPPEILIVLDTSTSMNDAFDGPCAGGCGANSKWAAAVTAIESLTGRSQPTVYWGLQLFTNPGDACAAAGVAVPVGPTSATGIRSELSRRSAGGTLLDPGNSPTRAAIGVAVVHLTARTAPASAERAILLMTDGEPECRVGAIDGVASDAAGAVQAITNAATAGWPTLVAGIGVASDAETALSNMAQAGGLPRDASPAYYPVSSADDLVAAVDLLAARMSCTFSIPPPPTTDGRTSRGNISVMIDGTQIWQDANNGWNYLDANQDALKFHGSACDAARAGGSVSIMFLGACA